MRQIIVLIMACLVLASCKGKKQEVGGPMVSVICPTYARPDKHPLLYLAFSQQSYPRKELLIYDDSESPSPFFQSLDDNRVTYVYDSERLSIGAKRNALIKISKGELIAHFDDDDYYAPLYLETMVYSLGDADLVKFSSWLAFRESDQTLWEWDTTTLAEKQYVISGWSDKDQVGDLRPFIDDEEGYCEANTWGYGFSFVYRKSLWEECHFPNTSSGEDALFAKEARAQGKDLVHLPDENHLTVHTIHPLSTSRIFPQKKLSTDNWIEIVGLEAEPWISVR